LGRRVREKENPEDLFSLCFGGGGGFLRRIRGHKQRLKSGVWTRKSDERRFFFGGGWWFWVFLVLFWGGGGLFHRSRCWGTRARKGKRKKTRPKSTVQSLGENQTMLTAQIEVNMRGEGTETKRGSHEGD